MQWALQVFKATCFFSNEVWLIQMKGSPRELYDHVREIDLPKEQGRSSMQELLCMVSTLKFWKDEARDSAIEGDKRPRCSKSVFSSVHVYQIVFKVKVFYNVMYVMPYSVCLFLMKFLFRLPWISCSYWLYSGQTLASIGWRLPKTWSHSTFACAKRVFSRQTL